MASPSFKLEILTPRKRVFAGEIVSLTAPGELGYIGILANHAPLVTTLVPGNVTWRDPSGNIQTLRSAGEGMLEVRKNEAKLLLDDVVSEKS